MTYRDMFEDVVQSGKYTGAVEKVKRLTQLIFANDRTQNKADCAWEALEQYESMTGRYFDPTQDQFDDIVFSIV